MSDPHDTPPASARVVVVEDDPLQAESLAFILRQEGYIVDLAATGAEALASMRIAAAAPQLIQMMQDERAEHRISGLWALREIGVWNMVNEVGKLAKDDPNLRVRRYAMTVLRSVAEMIQNSRKTGS